MMNFSCVRLLVCCVLMLFVTELQALASGSTDDQVLPCENYESQPESFILQRRYCDRSGTLRRLEHRFVSTQGLSVLWIFDDHGRISHHQIYDIEGKRTAWTKYEFVEKNREFTKYIKSDLNPAVGTDNLLRFGQGRTLVRIEGDFPGREFREKSWRHDPITGLLRYMDQFDLSTGETIEARTFFKQDGQIEKKYRLYFRAGGQLTGELDGFTVLNAEEEKIGEFFERGHRPWAPEQVQTEIDRTLQEQLQSSAIQPWMVEHYQNQTRRPFLVIDTGFDLAHPALTYRLWNPSNQARDKLQTVFSDWQGFQFGWYSDQSPKVKKEGPWIDDRLTFSSFGGGAVPFSHGTHVASIALGEVQDFALVGFAGNFTDPNFLDRIGKFISEFKIPVVNMSFGFGDHNDPMAPPEESRVHLSNMIQSNPSTLFVAAAGNTPKDFEQDHHVDFPASFTFDHLLVVAATDQAEVKESDLLRAKLADFTSRGAKTVDLAAPGTNTPGAMAGGGLVPESGTSMAAPQVVNLVLQMLNLKPDLTPLQAKEILMKTVLIHDLQNPWPLVSGGQIFPRRALRATELVKQGLSIEEAALNAHQEVSLPGHGYSRQELVNFWRSRQL